MLEILVAALLFATPAPTAAAPAPCANADTAKLAFLEGRWNVSSRFRLKPNPPEWEEAKGTAEIEYLHPGCVLIERLEMPRQGKAFKGSMLYAFSPTFGKYQAMVTDSEHGGLFTYQGGFQDGRLIVDAELELRGRKTLLRRVVSPRPDGFEIQDQRSVDGGQTWDTAWTLIYSRREEMPRD
ncbi:MAG TPA: DUF1579 family protein [Thermoanaerobaculia bacterium]